MFTGTTLRPQVRCVRRARAAFLQALDQHRCGGPAFALAAREPRDDTTLAADHEDTVRRPRGVCGRLVCSSGPPSGVHAERCGRASHRGVHHAVGPAAAECEPRRARVVTVHDGPETRLQSGVQRTVAFRRHCDRAAQRLEHDIGSALHDEDTAEHGPLPRRHDEERVLRRAPLRREGQAVGRDGLTVLDQGEPRYCTERVSDEPGGRDTEQDARCRSCSITRSTCRRRPSCGAVECAASGAHRKPRSASRCSAAHETVVPAVVWSTAPSSCCTAADSSASARTVSPILRP